MKRENFFSVLEHRDFVVFSAGQTVSLFGDKLNHMAMLALLHVYAPGPGALSALAVSFTLPVLIFGPAAGVLVDRWNRKRILISCDVGRALLVASVPWVILKNEGNVHSVYFIVFVVFLFGLFFNTAKMSVIPNLVSQRQLLAANSVNTFVGRFATFMGVLAGGLIVEWQGWGKLGWSGWHAGFYLDAMTYLLSALALTGIGINGLSRSRLSRSPDPPADGKRIILTFATKAFRTIVRDLLEAYRLIYRDRAVLFVMASLLLLCVVGGSSYVLIIQVVQQTLAKGTAGVGMLAGAAAVGMLCSSFLFGMFGQRSNKRRVILVGFTIVGALMMISANVTSFSVFCLLGFIGGAALAPVMISQDTLLHEVVPELFRGRIFSAKEWTVNGVFMLTALIIGVTAEFVSVRSVLFGVGILVGLLGLAGATTCGKWSPAGSSADGMTRIEDLQ